MFEKEAKRFKDFTDIESEPLVPMTSKQKVYFNPSQRNAFMEAYPFVDWDNVPLNACEFEIDFGEEK